MAVGATSRRWRARFVVGSLLLHALLVVVAARRGSRGADPVVASLSAGELEVEVLPPPPEEAEVAVGSEAEPSRASSAPRRGVAPHAAVAVAEVSEADAATDAGAEGASGEDAAAPTAATSAAAPHLSLAQLGVDGSNPFIDRADPAAVRAARAARVKARLDKALAQGIVNQEAAAGRGSGSPVLRALEGAVYASTLPLNTHATLSFVIDSSGKVVSSSLGEAEGGDRPAWLRLAHETARALATRTLPVPKGKSVRLTVAITSRLVLPSGADPGFEVDLFGLPIKKGAGPRSTRLDILNPTKGAPLSLAGDPADLGAHPRRMVNAHVVSEELL